MKMRVSLVAALLVLGKMTFAQSVEDGKRFLYYQRYLSAKDAFQKALAAKPNDGETTYWLGQAELGLKDSAGAKDLYQKAASSNDPWLLVGIGEIELKENNTADARNRFETAISLTGGKNPGILAAVARANIDATRGDATYAIEKLTQAIEKEKKHVDPALYVDMGDAYAKLIDGGNAVTNYGNALASDPKYAAAHDGIGLIYESQKNPSQYVPEYEAAIAADPNYAPAYYRLYVHYFSRDIEKSRDYLQKYSALADPSPLLDQANVDILWASGHDQDAIDKANALLSKESVGDKAHLYRLIAYSYLDLKDYANAKKYIDMYLANPVDVAPGNYQKAAIIYFRGKYSEDSVFAFLKDAITVDTFPNDKLTLMGEAANIADSMQDPVQKGYWMGQIYINNKTPSNLDLYNWGTQVYQAADYVRAKDSTRTGASNALYQQADSIFGLYTTKYPDQVYGYYWRARANWSMDTLLDKGLANTWFDKTIMVADSSKDSANYVEQVKVADQYFAMYNLHKKDYKNTLDYVNKYLMLDPSSEQYKHLKEVLERYVAKLNGAGKGK